MSILDNGTFKKMDEKVLRVIGSCTTVEQLIGARKYIILAERYMRKHVKTPQDFNALDKFYHQRLGFVNGMIWCLIGRNY